MDEVDEKASKMTDIRTIFLTSILSALSLVVGLFWNDAIKSAIEQIVPNGEGVYYKFVAAILVTVIIIIIIFILMRSQKIASRKIENLLLAKK